MQRFCSIYGQSNGFIDNFIWHAWMRDSFIPMWTTFAKIWSNHILLFSFLLSHTVCINVHQLSSFLRRTMSCSCSTCSLFHHSSTNESCLQYWTEKDFWKLICYCSRWEWITKHNRVLHTSVYCLWLVLGGFYITNGFSRAWIHPFSKQASWIPS